MLRQSETFVKQLISESGSQILCNGWETRVMRI